MNKTILSILFFLLSLQVRAQYWQPQQNAEFQRIRSLVSFGLPIRDTIFGVGFTNRDSIGSVIMHPNGNVYVKGKYGWNAVTYTTANVGTVTSIGLSAPSIFSVSSSPITSNGTIALSFAADQPANQLLATPNGTTGQLSLRSLVAADIPLLDAAKITSGTFGVARGGTGLSSLGSSLQQIRVNSAGTALEYFSTSAEILGAVYGDTVLNDIPAGVPYMILKPSGNNTIEVAAAAGYPGSTGRVCMIFNATNYTYLFHGITVSNKVVYVVWTATNTPSIINL